MNAKNYEAKDHYQDPQVARQYDDERFQSWHGRMSHQIEKGALERMLDKYCKEPGNVLDLPCGTGRLLDVFIDRGFQVTGGDISAEMLAVARGKFQARPEARFEIANVEVLPFPDLSFDYLTSYRLICHLPPAVRRRALDEMIRVTRKTLILNFHFQYEII